MAGRWLRRASVLIALMVAEPMVVGAQDADDIAALNRQVVQFYGQGKYAEATEAAKRALSLAEKALGPDHSEVGQSLNNLALLHKSQGGYAEAEPMYQRSLAIREKALGPDHPDVGQSLNNLAGLYESQGRTAEAEPLYQRSLTIREKALGADHPDVGQSLNNLAGLYQDQGRYAEAELLYKRSLSIREKALGPDHPDVGQSLNNVAGLYQSRGRYTEAKPLYQRSLVLWEKALGPDHPYVGTVLNNLALLYQSQSRYAEAEPLYKRSLAIREKALGPDHPDVGTSVNNLASLYRAQGRIAEAEPLFKRSLALREKALGPDHPDVGTSVNNLAGLYESQGRTAEAESLYKRSLSIREKALGPDHLDVGQLLNNLAGLYQSQGRTAEVEPLYKRSLSITEKALGPDHPYVGTVLNNLALLYESQSRYAEAEPLYKRSLALREKALGSDHPDVGTSVNNLAALYRSQGRYAKAEPLYQRSLALFEKALGSDHPYVGTVLNNLALLYESQSRYAEAEPLYKRSLALREKALGPDHPDVGVSLNNLARLYFAQRDWSRAADAWRRSAALTVRRAQRGTTVAGVLLGTGKSEADQNTHRFYGLLKAMHRLALEQRGTHASLSRETFVTAQWVQSSEAAASLAQMVARGTKGDAALSQVVRERQDLVAEWQKRDGARSAAVSQAPDKRDRAGEAANNARLVAIDARIADIDKRLVAEFPDYAALSRPEPLSAEDVQVQLRPDEALILFLDTPEWKPTPEETFVWVVTKTNMRWVRSELGTPALKREVAALRCGLDAVAWESEGGAKCSGLLSIAPDKAPKGNAPLPFDAARAHALYKALFGQVEDLIRDKHLLVVPSGPLTQLPFQVLVTVSTASGEYRSAAWLARKHAITVLPAVSSLKALRRVARLSAATKPMIGFGNPLLDGDPAERPWEAEWARLARQKQSCPQTPWQRVAALFERRRGVVPMATRSGRPDLDHLRVQSPLHDTADELCAVAKDIKLAPDDIVLGTRATEATIKRLSAEGRLANYRVVHFATHGTLSGEISGTSEPGLILTPPKEQTELDDGYLSASEVAALKLDADWVILSACNTAAGGAQGAEALSGLARAFIYAGARALLVSHWSVDSAATVKLITGAVGAITRDAKLGRAEALRRAMLAMIDKGESKEAHPAYWAPFVVVGEGAAAK
jgi:CHAT domain-containing protein/Tfp pilus assembly protein PilF